VKRFSIFTPRSTLDENGEVVGETNAAGDDVEVTVDENGKFVAPF